MNPPATRPRAVVLDGHPINPAGDNPWTELEKLVDLSVHPRTRADEVIARAAGASILLTNKTPLPRRVLEALPELRFIPVLATGYNVVDTEAAAERGIVVSNVPSYATETVAQHTFALLLELCHRCGTHSEEVHAGAWGRAPDFCFWQYPLVELAGKRLGIIGYGRIGQRVAAMARAFGMEVVYFSRHQPPGERGGETFVSWEEALAASDVISLHCALTPESQGCINRETLARMKRSAFLVNTSRGALIDEPALREALEAETIAGAALDVLSTEPPAGGNPLLGAPRCLITPHMAWTGVRARRQLMAATVANVRAFLAGEPICRVTPSGASGTGK